jgi:hypothetical protein
MRAAAGARGSRRVPREFALVCQKPTSLAFQSRGGAALFTIVVDLVAARGRSPDWD